MHEHRIRQIARRIAVNHRVITLVPRALGQLEAAYRGEMVLGNLVDLEAIASGAASSYEARDPTWDEIVRLNAIAYPPA